MVRGVASSLLKNVKAEGLLGNEALKTMSEKMSSLQRTALLEAVRIRWVHSERDGKASPNKKNKKVTKLSVKSLILGSALSLSLGFIKSTVPSWCKCIWTGEAAAGFSPLFSVSVHAGEGRPQLCGSAAGTRLDSCSSIHTRYSNIKIQIHYLYIHVSLISLFLSVVSFPSEEDFG